MPVVNNLAFFVSSKDYLWELSYIVVNSPS